jgi:Holliday junction resolvase
MPSHRTHKARGSAAERELVHRFWDAGWAAFRSPASGSMGHELPDVIAGHGARKVAIECKITQDEVKYIPKREVEELLFFAQRFGCEAWLGVKFLRKGWFFLNPEDCRQTPESYAIPLADAQRKGLSFEELVR